MSVSFSNTGLPSGNVVSLAISGTNAVAALYDSTGTATGMGIYYSTNTGANWTQSNVATGIFSSVAISGNNAVAVSPDSSNNGIYYSTNGGQSWIQSKTGGFYSVSITGNNAVAGSYEITDSGFWYSINGGQSWIQSNITTGAFHSVAVSDNGNNAVAGSYSNLGIYYFNFTNKVCIQSNVKNRYMNSIAISGTNAVAASSGNYGIYQSVNGGQTWTQTVSSGFFNSAAISGNNIVVGSQQNLGIYCSTDMGVNWKRPTNKNGTTTNAVARTGDYTLVAINGNNVLAVNGGGTYGIVFSSNAGTNFARTNLRSNIFNSIAVNNNNYFIAGSGSNLGIYYTPQPLCLNHDTKILCLTSEGEKYVAIQDLREGDFVKSYLHGYRKIQCIGKNTMINNAKFWNLSMWKMEKTDSNELIEDLIMLGGHSLLVDSLSEEIQEKYKENNCFDGVSPTIDKKLFLLAAFNNSFVQLKDSNVYTYYQLALDNEGDINRRFGVWANGLLVETPSEEQFNYIKWCEMEEME